MGQIVSLLFFYKNGFGPEKTTKSVKSLICINF